MVQIMNDLVVSSMDYVSTGRGEGTIKLRASLKETGVDLDIEDDGKGIPEWIESTGARVFDMQHAATLHQGFKGNLHLSRQEDSLFTIQWKSKNERTFEARRNSPQ